MCTYEVEDKSTNGVQSVLKLLQHFFPYAQKQLGFHKPVMVSFQSDEENANKLLGRTAHYNPDEFSIAIFVDGRHPKDILRSLSHELVHHAQNCNGDFESTENLGLGYAQENGAMRNAELDAYKRGNIIFRDFEDLIKKGDIEIEIDFEKAGEPNMSLKEWKNNELNMLLLEKWGYKPRNEEQQIFLPEGHPGHSARKEDHEDEEVNEQREDIGSKEHDDEEGNRPSFAKKMGLEEVESLPDRYKDPRHPPYRPGPVPLPTPGPRDEDKPPWPPPGLPPGGPDNTPDFPDPDRPRPPGNRWPPVRRNESQKTITLDEARDLARRIFEKLTKKTK